jgi:hypothetical protein
MRTNFPAVPFEDCDGINPGSDQASWPRRSEQLIGDSHALEAVLEKANTSGVESLHSLDPRGCGHRPGTDRARVIQDQPAAWTPVRLAALRRHVAGSDGSELFGNAKGAFTGAIAQKLGRFESVDKSTLFLDEVEDFPCHYNPSYSAHIARTGIRALR